MTLRCVPKVLALLALAVCSLPAGSADWIVEENVPVRMRDGVVLRADVMRPQGEGRVPALVYRTPYNKVGARQEYSTFRKAVERGYAVVIQDVRGRYASDRPDL